MMARAELKLEVDQEA